MTVPLPLRDYKQMARVVKTQGDASNDHDRVPFKMAFAYGKGEVSPTQKRERTLDELGIDSRTSRQSERAATDHFLSTRESAATFHQLDKHQQSYFTGTTPEIAQTRMAGWAGTKSRVYLGSDHPAQNVKIQPATTKAQSDHLASSGRPSPHMHANNESQSMTTDNHRRSVNSQLPKHPHLGWKNQVVARIVPNSKPEPKNPEVNGTKGSSLDFTLF